MSVKEALRKKFIFLRKKKYFTTQIFFFNPLLKMINEKKIKSIALYYPSNFEVSTLPLFEVLKKRNVQTFLPKLLPNGTMKFTKWSFLDPLKVNKNGFLEPLNLVSAINPDIIIVPVVAFDTFNNRLGYGKGYYDKFLSKYIRQKKSALTIGLAFSFQKYKKIPTNKFDIKLNYILTEKGNNKFK